MSPDLADRHFSIGRLLHSAIPSQAVPHVVSMKEARPAARLLSARA